MHGLTVALDKLQLTGWGVVIPGKIVRQECQQLALVGRVEIIKLVALRLQYGKPIGRPLYLNGENKVRVDFGRFQPWIPYCASATFRCHQDRVCSPSR